MEKSSQIKDGHKNFELLPSKDGCLMKKVI